MPESSATSASTPFQNAALRFEHWGYRHASRKHFSVRGLDLNIEAGQRVLLLGASGIGKSTILEGGAGLLGSGEYVQGTETAEDGTVAVVDAEGGATEGRVLVDDVPVREARGRVGLVLQDRTRKPCSNGSATMSPSARRTLMWNATRSGSVWTAASPQSG